MLDRCVSGEEGEIASVTIKRRLTADSGQLISKKSVYSSENLMTVSNETLNTVQNLDSYETPDPSLNETITIHQNTNVLLAEYPFRDQARWKSDFFLITEEARKARETKAVSITRTISDTDAHKFLRRNLDVSRKDSVNPLAQSTSSFPGAFDVITNVTDENPAVSNDVVRANRSQEETEDTKKKCEITVSSGRATSPPRIKVVDYDDYVTSISSSSSKWDQHACSKCTSEGVLRMQIDPFRLPTQNTGSNDVTTPNARRRYNNDLFRRKQEIIRGKSCMARRCTSNWYEKHLIERRRRRRVEEGCGENKQLDGKKNGSSPATCRKEVTLRRHYYPEGGWGYIIVTCSALVHFLGMGLQFAAPGVWHISAELKFRHPPLHSAGKKCTSSCTFDDPRVQMQNG